jgi:tryptophan synthase alpha chain
LEALGKANVSIPIVLMGYYNPVLNRGLAGFAADAKGAGASGTIISDLTPEEAGAWKAASHSEGLDTVFLVAPTSTDERLRIACEQATGFVYAVSRTGVTGLKQSAPAEVTDLVSRVRRFTQLPVCVGFGISQPEHVRAVCEVADGAVVGSWLVNLIASSWNGGAGRAALIDAVRALKHATRG